MPADFRQPLGRLAAFDGIRAGGVAVQAALVDTLADGGQTEQRQDQIKVPTGNAASSGAFAIFGDVLLFRWNAGSFQVHFRNIGPGRVAIMIGQAVVGEVGQRIAERSQLPVDHGQHLRPVRVIDQVFHAEVAMDDGGLVIIRHVLTKPGETVFTLIFFLAYVFAADLDKPSTPDFALEISS